ncbi:MAG: hypothetical protein F6K55_46850 [Moorea sp. SIO4A3]|nr:hypothetical protein [Moorena sp. SIO4A3]
MTYSQSQGNDSIRIAQKLDSSFPYPERPCAKFIPHSWRSIEMWGFFCRTAKKVISLSFCWYLSLTLL